MKKTMKLCKILLLIATIFSYVSSPIAVLANEIATPVIMSLDAVDADDDGTIDNYKLTYISEDPNDYEEEKTYTIKLVTNVTYTNGDEEKLSEEEISVLGTTLNSMRSSYELESPVLEYYNGVYKLEVTVYDGETEMYSNEYTYENSYEAKTGLTGKLNGVLTDTSNLVVYETTEGNYNVTEEGKYTQSLNILTGELSPIGMYRIVYTDGETIEYSDVMTGEVLRTYDIIGTLTDLTGKLYGTYPTYTDSVTIEEVKGSETEGYTTIETYTYSYSATIKYGDDNNDLFKNIYTEYGVAFEGEYLGVPAKGLWETETVITIQELVDTLVEFEEEKEIKTVIEVLDENGNLLDLTAEDVLASELKNGYVVNFINGATAGYEVVVLGDADFDNDFDGDDLVGVMEGYLNEENMPSMDLVLSQVEEGEQLPEEETGTITYEDIVFANELLKGENADFDEKEIGNATIVFGEIPELVYVGDILEIEVLVSADSSEELIDGIDGLVTYTGLKLDDVNYAVFNSLVTGVSNGEGRLVGISSVGLEGETVLLTLVFTVIEEGTVEVNFSGNVSRYMSQSEFELTAEIESERIISTNNNLSSLKASVGSFDVEFDKDVTVYTLTVPYNTEKVILSGALEDIYSTVDGLIEYELTESKTTAIITVTAEDGTTKVYTVYIVKENPPVTKPVVYYYSSNNYLKSLEVEGYEVEFDKNTNEYKITVKNDVNSLEIKALAEDYRARVEITGNNDFKEGENTVTVTVTAENGNTREYKLVVTKEEKKQAVTNIDDSSNTAEKIVIIVLIILVVLGLLYLIFKKDDEENVDAHVKREDPRNNEKDNSNKNTNNNNKNNGNKKKKKKKS